MGTHEPRAAERGDESALLHRLLAGDPTASHDLVQRYLDPLADGLERRYPRLDPDLCQNAAEDALLALIHHPERYQPARGGLWSYLSMSANGDLLNALERERRHQQRGISFEAVELLPAQRNYMQDERADPAWQVLKREEVAERTASVPSPAPIVTQDLPQAELQVLTLMREGERRTEFFAAALSITHLPVSEQKREVKRVKDKLKKRLLRAEGGSV